MNPDQSDRETSFSNVKMSLVLRTATTFPCILRKLLKNIKKTLRLLNGRIYISKLLIKLPKGLFPNYRIVVTPVIIESNRRTLNFLSEDSLERSFSTEFYDSLSSSSSGALTRTKNSPPNKKKVLKKCCKHCRRLYYPVRRENNPEDNPNSTSTPQTISLRPEKHVLWKIVSSKSSSQDQNRALDACDVAVPQRYSTPIKSWSDEVEMELQVSKMEVNRVDSVPSPPALPADIFLEAEGGDEYFNRTPLRRITVGDLRSVKLKPLQAELPLPKTPEVHDMMAVLRKRFAAMHSPLFDGDTTITSGSGEDLSDFYSDFSTISWNPRSGFQIGVV